MHINILLGTFRVNVLSAKYGEGKKPFSHQIHDYAGREKEVRDTKRETHNNGRPVGE
jgi:hypothetical protein